MAHLLRATFVGTFVAVATLGACTLKTDGTGATSGPVGGQGAGGDAGEAGTGGAASEGGTGGVGGEGGAGGGIAGAGPGGSAGGGASGAGASGAGASGAGMSGGGAGGSAGASGTGGTGGAPICVADGGKAVNVVKCDNFQDCTNQEPPSCPPGGESCEIQCSGDQGCLFATIDCNGAADCVVRCSGYRACAGAKVRCGPGTCKVICGDESEEEDDTESCIGGTAVGDMQVDCSGTTGDCTICGVNEPGVTIVNTQACTANGCSCGEIGSCN